jgi:TetR/AcrR family transcriptional regulator, cholesterol catabolism regulator
VEHASVGLRPRKNARAEPKGRIKLGESVHLDFVNSSTAGEREATTPPPFQDGPSVQLPDRIKGAAARLFQVRGFAGVTIDEIVQEVGVTKGGFYHYFESKGALLYALHAEYVTYSIGCFRRVFATAPTSEAKLRAFVHESFRQIDQFQEYVGVLFDERRALPADKVDDVEGMKAELRHMLKEVIDDGIANGEFRPVNSRATSLAIFGMCTWGYLWYRRGDELTFEQLATIFADLAVRGVQAGD